MRMQSKHLFTAALCLIAFGACTSSNGSTNGGGTGGDLALGTGGATGGGSGVGAGSGGTTTTTTGSGGTTSSGSGGTSSGSGGTSSGSGGASGGGGMAEAMISPFGGLIGSALFTENSTDMSVTVTVTVMNCPDGVHPVHIHQGTSCDTADMQGAHWDMTRGEGIPSITCSGGMGMTMLTRPTTDPTLKWSIGGDMTTDVTGHVVVVHDPAPDGGTAPRIACGKIMAGTGGGSGTGGTGSGSGGSGSGSGGTGSGSGGSSGNMDAGAGMKAEAMIKPFGGLTGTADFTQSGSNVTVMVSVMNCPDGMHPIHIHQGTSCDDATMQGAHWDMTRGEGIPNIMCSGGMGTTMLTRMPTDPTTTWSVGGDMTTNVVGHVVVVHDPAPDGGTAPRIACGKIMMK
jgi:Cu/Zn superoxide dismutase